MSEVTEFGAETVLPVAPPARVVSEPLAIREDVVNRATQDLAADFSRQGGVLRQSQFDRLVFRRNLSPAEMIKVVERLAELGVILSDASDEQPPQPRHPQDQVPSTDAPRREAPTRSSSKGGVLLTRAEEAELGRQVQLAMQVQPDLDDSAVVDSNAKAIVQRGLVARDKMIVGNLGLIGSIIKSLKRPIRSFEYSDLFQEGVFGLVRAIEKFDPGLGLKFSTYATWWIRQSIFRGLDDKDKPIRLPVHRMDGLRRLRSMRKKLAAELGRTPTFVQLAEALGWPKEKLLFTERLEQLECVSLDAPLNSDGDGTLKDVIPAHNASPLDEVRNNERREKIQKVLQTLTPREQVVIERRFGIGRYTREETLEEIGVDFKVTRERIRQIEAKALRKLHRRIGTSLAAALL